MFFSPWATTRTRDGVSPLANSRAPFHHANAKPNCYNKKSMHQLHCTTYGQNRLKPLVLLTNRIAALLLCLYLTTLHFCFRKIEGFWNTCTVPNKNSKVTCYSKKDLKSLRTALLCISNRWEIKNRDERLKVFSSHSNFSQIF